MPPPSRADEGSTGALLSTPDHRYPAPDSPSAPTANAPSGGADEPYPPPTSAPTPVPTAAVEADGYRALPREVDSHVVTLDEVPHADFVRRLETQLQAGDAAALADYIWDGRGGLDAGPIEERHTAYGYWMQSDEARRILQQLFESGSTPRIEGVHAEAPVGEASDCLSIVTSGWRGVTYPRPTTTVDPATATAVATESEMGPPPTEVVVSQGEHRWDMCVLNATDVKWNGWWWGGYGELLAAMDGVSWERPYMAIRPLGSTLPYTTTGRSPITFEVPAGWIVSDTGGGLVMLMSFNATVGRGGVPDYWTKIDFYSARDDSLADVWEALSQGDGDADADGPPDPVDIVELERLTLGPNAYPAILARFKLATGHSRAVFVDVGTGVFRLQCFGDCAPLMPIAETIRPAAPPQ